MPELPVPFSPGMNYTEGSFRNEPNDPPPTGTSREQTSPLDRGQISGGRRAAGLRGVAELGPSQEPQRPRPRLRLAAPRRPGPADQLRRPDAGVPLLRRGGADHVRALVGAGPRSGFAVQRRQRLPPGGARLLLQHVPAGVGRRRSGEGGRHRPGAEPAHCGRGDRRHGPARRPVGPVLDGGADRRRLLGLRRSGRDSGGAVQADRRRVAGRRASCRWSSGSRWASCRRRGRPAWPTAWPGCRRSAARSRSCGGPCGCTANASASSFSPFCWHLSAFWASFPPSTSPP